MRRRCRTDRRPAACSRCRMWRRQRLSRPRTTGAAPSAPATSAHRRPRSSTVRRRPSPRARSSVRSRPSPRAPASPPHELAVKTSSQGDGADGHEGDYVQVNYLGQVWDTGKPSTTPSTASAPLPSPSVPGQVIKGWDQGLGARRSAAGSSWPIPPAARLRQRRATAGAASRAPTRWSSSSTSCRPLNAESPPRAARSRRTTPACRRSGPTPTARRPPSRSPRPPRPRSWSPTTSSRATAPEVKATDSVLVQYKGVFWDDGKEFDSTYSRGAGRRSRSQQVIKGWDRAWPARRSAAGSSRHPAGPGLRRKASRQRHPEELHAGLRRSTSWRSRCKTVRVAHSTDRGAVRREHREARGRLPGRRAAGRPGDQGHQGGRRRGGQGRATPSPSTTSAWPSPPARSSTPAGTAARRSSSRSASARSSPAGTRACRA